MNIILTGFQQADAEKYRDILEPISSKNDLQIFDLGQECIDFFNNAVIPAQMHVDLLIIAQEIRDWQTNDLLVYFREDGRTYSQNNFKLSALPMMVVAGANAADQDGYELDVERISDLDEKKRDENFLQTAKDTVMNWRKEIYNDFEILGLGLDYRFDKIDMGYAVRVKSSDTKILSNGFLIKQQGLPYLWIKKDFFELESSIDELDYLVNDYLNFSRKELDATRWEDRLQDFFNRNPKFLFQNNFANYWSQPKIDIPNSNRSYKPDFIMEPELHRELSKNWEIMDLKLPIQDFMQKTNFHPTFTSKFLKCLEQVKNYKNFFKDDNNKSSIEKVLNFHPKFPKVTLVVGRRDNLYANQDLLYQKLNDHSFSDIYLMTYDEIIDNQKRNLERLLDEHIN